jgi:hypothetical protein
MESSPLPVIVRPAQEYFTYMEIEYILFFVPLKNCWIFIMPHLRFSGLIRRTAPFSRLLRHSRVGGGSILARRPVRIRVWKGPPHPLVCRKRRLNGAVLRMRPEKPRPRVAAGMARKRSLSAQRPWAPSIGLNFAALHRHWLRLHISEIFLSGT